MFDYYNCFIFALAAFAWLLMRMKFLLNWNCLYIVENWVGELKKKIGYAFHDAPLELNLESIVTIMAYKYRRYVAILHWEFIYIHLHYNSFINVGAGDLSDAESKLFMADHSKKNRRGNQTQALGDMLSETRDMLRQFYQPFNVNLSRLLQSDQYLWSNWSS